MPSRHLSSLKTNINLQLHDHQPLILGHLNHDPHYHTPPPYFLIDDALRLRSSDLLFFSSLTRFARMEAYSFCSIVLVYTVASNHRRGSAYRSILRSFSLTTLESHSVTLVLEALRSNQALDFRGFCVWLLAFAFGCDFAADDEFANLCSLIEISTPAFKLQKKPAA